MTAGHRSSKSNRDGEAAIIGTIKTMKLEISLKMVASVPVRTQRTWQRKWRDVEHAHGSLVEVYQGDGVNADDFVRRIETFFKTCHELADWIHRDTGRRAAFDYVRKAPTLMLCDAVAQTAKHHTRHQPGKDPITAVVNEIFSDEAGKRAEIMWTSSSGSGKDDALDLANRCIAEWEKFFQENNLDPAG